MTEAAKRFNKLSMRKRSSLLDQFGHWIWFTDYQNYRISLFEIDGEFVEVWYDHQKRNISQIRIPEYEQMDIHLHSITLPLWELEK